MLQALADGSRRTLLEILRDHPATAGELAEAHRLDALHTEIARGRKTRP